MKIPSPADCGLPANFNRWRSNQEEAISRLLDPSKRVAAICAPTGFGKSAVNVGAALLSKEPTLIVTDSRGLQDQYMTEFESIGMVDIRGRNNYTCDLKDDYTCEEGYAARCPYKGTIGCPASKAEMKAATSSLGVTNYAKWTASKMFGQGMGHWKRLIFDEGHSAPDALSRAVQVVLNHREIEEGLQISFLPFPEADSFENWKAWAVEARALAQIALAAAQRRIAGLSDPKPTWVKHFTHMRNLTRKLATLSTARPKDWVVEEIEKGFQFDPIRPGRYSESTLLLRIKHIGVVSATLRPKTIFMIGVGKDNFTFKEFNSDFNPKRCPIYYIPTMRVDANNANRMATLWNRLDQIIAKRRDRKGIIHTVSYMRQQDILKSSRFAASMIINAKGEPPTETIETFMDSGPGTNLVSPSVGTGYDFKDDYCRWQFMCKIPFDPPSKVLKAREADDSEYRAYRAMQAMVQAFGRDVRSNKDWSERFIADQHLDWFLPRFGHLAPSSFHGFFRRVETVPPPPSLESMQ